MNDEKKPHIVDRIKDIVEKEGGHEVISPSTKAAKRRPKQPMSISVNGNGVNQVAGRDYFDHSIHIERIVQPPAIVKTGDGVLNAQQKAEILRLVDEVVKASKSRKIARTQRSVFVQLRNYMKVNSYSEIVSEDYAKAVAYLRRISSIDNSLPSARKKNPDWRKKRIAAIHARCKERGWEDWRTKYMKEKFGRESMIEMPDTEIEALYRAVMGKD